MKNINKIIIIILILSIALIFTTGCKEIETTEIIRIHIRANSNSEMDQAVKYKVKDEIVKFIEPLAADIKTKSEMYELLENNLSKIKEIADKKLILEGKNYLSNVVLRTEEFPIRSYDDVTLPAGVYDALIIELGEAKGDNWWCVAYPPLCFLGATPNGTEYFTYKSKLLEILKKG